MPTPSLSGLARSVAFDVNRTFGGGNASIELLRRTFTSRAWLDEATHGLFVAIARLTPGTNILAYCVMLGWRHHRAAGSLAALAAASVPASVIVFLLASALVQIDRYWGVQAILAAGVLAASVLVLASAWYLIRPYLVHGVWRRTLIVTTIAVVTIAFGATPVRTLLAAAIVGILLPPRDTVR